MIDSIANENHRAVPDHRKGMEGFTREISPWTLYVPVHSVPLSSLQTLMESTSVDHDDDVHAVLILDATPQSNTADRATKGRAPGSKMSLLCRNKRVQKYHDSDKSSK